MTNNFWLDENNSLLKFKSYSDLVENLYIKAIIDSFNRLQTVPNINTFIENIIRNHLAYDLERTNTILRPFIQAKILKLTKENTLLESPTKTKRTDIEFFISGLGDFVVECKNLKSADQRYIDEGLNRFTSEYYSMEDSDAGMIGFIIGGNIDSIITNLIAKVEKESTFILLIPNLSTRKCLDYNYSFHSTHKRPTKPDIYIHHLFVSL